VNSEGADVAAEERTEGERDGGAPLIPSIPQDEREAVSGARPEQKKRGGGPKSEAGKAVVARNPIKLGVLALRLPPRRALRTGSDAGDPAGGARGGLGAAAAGGSSAIIRV